MKTGSKIWIGSEFGDFPIKFEILLKIRLNFYLESNDEIRGLACGFSRVRANVALGLKVSFVKVAKR